MFLIQYVTLSGKGHIAWKYFSNCVLDQKESSNVLSTCIFYRGRVLDIVDSLMIISSQIITLKMAFKVQISESMLRPNHCHPEHRIHFSSISDSTVNSIFIPPTHATHAHASASDHPLSENINILNNYHCKIVSMRHQGRTLHTICVSLFFLLTYFSIQSSNIDSDPVIIQIIYLEQKLIRGNINLQKAVLIRHQTSINATYPALNSCCLSQSFYPLRLMPFDTNFSPLCRKVICAQQA